MHIISKARLRAFWGLHPRSQSSLAQWFRVTKKADWSTFAEVRQQFPSADWYDPYVIFDIGGNKYRLIAAIHFNTKRVYVRHILTHAEYSRGKWKTE